MISGTTNHYRTLGVDGGVDSATIRRAYRERAALTHPDTHPDDPRALEQFRAIQEAFRVLSDPKARRAHDEYLADVARASGYVDEELLGDFEFGSILTNTGKAAGMREDRPSGFLRRIKALRPTIGGLFDTSGKKKPAKKDGFKGIDYHQDLHVSFVRSILGGEEEVVVRIDNGTKRIKVKLPPGVAEGKVLKLKGLGGPGTAGGPKGDLLLTVRVEKDPRFYRKGDDVFTDLTISLLDAVFGGTILVPTVRGEMKKVEVPQGSQSHARIKLHGQGIPGREGRPDGHHYVRIIVRIPTPADLDARGRKLLEQLRASGF